MDDVALLETFISHWAAQCEAAGMRLGTSKSEPKVLSWKRLQWSLQVGDELLPQL